MKKYTGQEIKAVSFKKKGVWTQDNKSQQSKKAVWTPLRPWKLRGRMEVVEGRGSVGRGYWKVEGVR